MTSIGPTCVVVFAKPPRPGRVKTRLGRTLTDSVAARLAGCFLSDTWQQVQRLPDVHPVIATPEPSVDHGVEAPLWDQGGGDLGARIERVLRLALERFPAVVALGADAPGTPMAHLEEALSGLRSAPAVLGPSEDGGFWALGVTRCPSGLLSDLPWSASDTATATGARLRSQGLPPRLLPTWFDLDEEPDLRRWRTQVPRSDAPRTHAALDDLGWP